MSIRRGDETDVVIRRIQARHALYQQYHSRLAPRHALFSWPESAILIEVQDELLTDLQLDSDEESVYRRMFLKELLRRLEEEVATHMDPEIVSGVCKCKLWSQADLLLGRRR